MNFPETILDILRKTFTYSGRSSRIEFIYWTAVVWATVMFLRFLGGWDFLAELGGIFSIMSYALILPPQIALITRRLHDINKSGWWQLLALVPLIGWLVVFLWMLRTGDNGPNRFGDDPLWPAIEILETDA